VQRQRRTTRREARLGRDLQPYDAEGEADTRADFDRAAAGILVFF